MDPEQSADTAANHSQFASLLQAEQYWLKQVRYRARIVHL
jgi:hypothetical protein